MPEPARPQGPDPRAAPPRTRARGRAGSRPSWPPRSSGRRPGSVKPDGYERRGRRGRAHHAPAAGRGGGDLPRLRAGEAQARPGRLRRPHHRVRRRARARHRVRGRAALAVPPPLRRRVPGRQRGAVPAAARLAGRPPRPVRRRRPRPGDLRVRRRRRVVPRRLPPLFPSERFPDGRGRAASGSNYRSTPQVVAAAGAVLGPPGRRRPPVHAARPDGPAPDFTEYDTAEDEARGVARAAPRAPRARSSRGRGWRALPRQRAVGAVRGGARRAPACRSASAAAGGSSTARRCRSRSTELRTAAARHRDGPSPSTSPTSPTPPTPSRSPRSAASTSTRWCGSGTSTSRPTAGAAASTGSSSSCRPRCAATTPATATGNAVELLTFHRAKGLEFDTVFVTGLERGLVPISHAKSTEALDEEQRLLYVALSRAERVLHLSWARERTVGGRAARAHAQQLDPTRRGRGAPPARRCRTARRRSARQHRRRARRVAHAKGGSTRTKTPLDVVRVRRAALLRAGRLAAAPVRAPRARPRT